MKLNKKTFWQNNKKMIILVIIWVVTICITVVVVKYLGKEKDSAITYTDKEVKDNITVSLSDYHRVSFFEPFDRTDEYDANFYRLDVYVSSLITTKVCITVTQYNDEVAARYERLNFNLLKDATVVKNTVNIDPNDLLYGDETFEDANLHWEVTNISSGECK
jgi:hypothetical protein